MQQEKPNKYRVVVSERAARMHVSCAAFLAEAAPEAAERLIDRFEAAARSLEQMPRRCPWLEGDYIPRGVYRYRLFAEHYMIVYQIEDDTVYADYVLDCRQDYGWLLR